MTVDPELQGQAGLGGNAATGADAHPGANVASNADVASDANETADHDTREQFLVAGFESPALLTAPIAGYAVDLEGEVCFWNIAAEQLFGWSADEVIGRIPPFITEADAPRAIDAFRRVLLGEAVVHEQFAPRRKDDQRLHVIASGTLVRDGEGRPIAALTLARDITTEVEADELRRAAEHKWRQVVLRTVDTVTVADAAGHVIESTGEIRPILGYPTDWWRDRSGFEILHPDELARAATDWATLLETPGNRVSAIYRVRHALGHMELMEFTGVNMFDNPSVGGIVVASRVVSQQRLSESLIADEAKVFELIAQDAPLTQIFEQIIAMVEYHTSGAAGILLVDELTGAITVGAQGSIPDDLFELARHTPVRTRPTDVPAGDGDQQREFDVREAVVIADFETDPRTAGYAEPVTMLGFRAAWSTAIIESRSGALYGLVGTFLREPRGPNDHERKVTEAASHLAAIAVERAGWQQELWRQARFDDLTELPNRSLIFETLDHTLVRANASHLPVTVMFIDLDRFKLINDSLGHPVGDELLASFAQRLRGVVGPDDFVGRMGADEFVVVFAPGVRAGEARLAAAGVAKALDQPFVVEAGDIYLTASIGIATAEPGRANADNLLQHADTAMFRAKDLGRDRIETFDKDLRSRALARLELDRDLRVALDRDQLVLHYQPEIDCRTGRIVGAEALLRWTHPERGLIPPDGFIAIAEETGLIVPIGHWVLDEAVRQARLWTDAVPSIEPFTVSVNLSARQLINRSLVDTVAFVLTRYDWPPSHLTLELTESILIEDRDATLFVLNRLRTLGVKLSIDDFGTGFASLDYLHRLHVDSIKIDRSFVSMLNEDGSGSPVVTAMMHMAKAFDLSVTAEGVEEVHQYEGLKAVDCDLAQGFLFARPLPAAELETMLRAHRRW